MTRPIRELNDVQHDVLEKAAQERQYGRRRGRKDRIALARTWANWAAQTENAQEAYGYLVEAAAFLLLEADDLNRAEVDGGRTPLAPSFDR